MAASAEGDGNHWPAFVDVLTAVIMVVIFLLVIMSGAVIMLSKRVVDQVRLETARQQVIAAKVPNPVVSPRADPGSSIADLGSVLRQETVVDGDQRLTIRTRETKETEHVAVKAIETPPTDNKGVAVRTADTLIDVAFEPAAIKYDEASEAQVTGFLRANPQPGAIYEIWSFAPQAASISEAQRIAFYRAVLTRNLLIRGGVAAANIQTQVRVTDPSSGTHSVRVVIKP